MGTWGCLVSDWRAEGRWQEGGQRQVFPAAVAAETPELSLQTGKRETESERACVYVSKRKSRGQTTSGASSRGSRLRGRKKKATRDPETSRNDRPERRGQNSEHTEQEEAAGTQSWTFHA